jgi:hypothetical protein
VNMKMKDTDSITNMSHIMNIINQLKTHGFEEPNNQIYCCSCFHQRTKESSTKFHRSLLSHERRMNKNDDSLESSFKITRIYR